MLDYSWKLLQRQMSPPPSWKDGRQEQMPPSPLWGDGRSPSPKWRDGRPLRHRSPSPLWRDDRLRTGRSRSPQRNRGTGIRPDLIRDMQPDNFSRMGPSSAWDMRQMKDQRDEWLLSGRDNDYQETYIPRLDGDEMHIESGMRMGTGPKNMGAMLRSGREDIMQENKLDPLSQNGLGKRPPRPNAKNRRSRKLRTMENESESLSLSIPSLLDERPIPGPLSRGNEWSLHDNDVPYSYRRPDMMSRESADFGHYEMRSARDFDHIPGKDPFLKEPELMPQGFRELSDPVLYDCTIAGCLVQTDNLRLHILRKHVPEILWTVEESDQECQKDLAPQRASYLKALAMAILGPKGTLQQLVDLVNGIGVKVPKDEQLGSSHWAMVEVCRHQLWPVPEVFSIDPVNSPAAMIHWRVQAILMGLLPEERCQNFLKVYRLPDSSSVAKSLPDRVPPPLLGSYDQF